MTPTPTPGTFLGTLHELQRLSATSEAVFDVVARLVSQQLACPIAWVSVEQADGGMWIAAERGLPRPVLPSSAAGLMSRLRAGGGTALAQPLAALAGIVVNQQLVGMVCAMDLSLHSFDDKALATLQDLGVLAGRLLESQLTAQRACAPDALRDKQAAELASLAKSEFLSRMSHEMRTPLNAVIGFSQLMSMNAAGMDSSTVREYATHVLDAGEHLLALIDEVLDLQKIEQGTLSLSLGAVNLHEAVARTIELLTPTAQAQQVQFDNRTPPGTWVLADMQRLRQVLINVASNAINYNHPGGSVRWWLEQPVDDRVTLCIQDTGSGMSSELVERLFQPFDRLGRETSTIQGAGLGLVIARNLTQAIGGRLEVQSEAGRGTCVRLDLQRSEAPPPVCAPPAEPTEERGPPLRMLYVEDNRINAVLFEEAIRMHGSHVDLRVAEDGDQALTLAQSWQPEVLVLDAHLPGISGFEVLRLLRTLPGLGAVPAYMCSADAMPEDLQRAHEAGFVGYWAKPIDIGTVLGEVEHCLQQARGGGGAAA